MGQSDSTNVDEASTLGLDHPLLTAKQEVELATAIEQAQYLTARLGQPAHWRQSDADVAARGRELCQSLRVSCPHLFQLCSAAVPGPPTREECFTLVTSVQDLPKDVTERVGAVLGFTETDTKSRARRLLTWRKDRMVEWVLLPPTVRYAIAQGEDWPDEAHLDRLFNEREIESLKKRWLQIIDDGAHARDLLSRCNLRLVARFARCVSTNEGLNLDAFQEGSLGLLKAVDDFDWRRRLRFSTHATWRIREAIWEGINRESGPIRIPRDARANARAYQRAADLLQTELGREPTMKELASRLGWRGARVSRAADTAQIMDASRWAGSPGFVRDGESDSWEDQLADPSFDDLTPFVPAQTPPKETSEFPGSLSPREWLVLSMRWGLDDGKKKTLEEIGVVLTVSRERVRQIEQRALKRLRKGLEPPETVSDHGGA